MQRTNSEYVLHTWPSHVIFTNALHLHTLQPMPYLVNYKVMSILCAFFILDSFQTQLGLKGRTNLAHRVKSKSPDQMGSTTGMHNVSEHLKKQEIKQSHIWLGEGFYRALRSLNPYNSVVWKSDHPREGFCHWWRKNWERERKGKAINHSYRGQPLWFKPDGRL